MESENNSLYKVTPYSNVEVKRLPVNPHKRNESMTTVPCTFLGGLCAQRWADLYAWERFLGPLEFARFIELGMGYGNTSIFFWLHCFNKHATYIGCENAKAASTSNSRIKTAINLQGCRKTVNLYDSNIASQICELIRNEGISVVFCDGIDKPYEFSLYAPGLKSGDFIAVHDWGRASKQEWLQETIDKYALIPVDHHVWDSANSITRLWKKT